MTLGTPKTLIPFHVPDITDDEINEVVDTLRTGWLTTGPKTKRFEDDFAGYMGAGIKALAVNSATSGLHLALEAVGVGPGDEVITTPFTFTATAEVIRYLGAHPVLVDVEDHTLNIDPAGIEAAITPRTRAIIPVHFGGLACDMEAILDIAKTHRLRVIEDAANALPATSNGRLVGTLDSDATVFSFYATKTLTTGEGGMVVTRNPEVAERCGIMRLHGIDQDAFDRSTAGKQPWFYSVVAPGFKYNMTDIAAAIGIHQLRKLEKAQRRRDYLARRYDKAFSDLDLRLPAHAPRGDQHAWHLYTIRLIDDAAISRDALIDEMAAEGIATSVHFIPLHLHPFWRDTYGLTAGQFPVATNAYERIVSLPLYSRMSDDDQDRIIAVIRRLLCREDSETAEELDAIEPYH